MSTTTTTDPYTYLEGFGNHFVSEALPDALPKGKIDLNPDIKLRLSHAFNQVKTHPKSVPTSCMPSSCLEQHSPYHAHITNEGMFKTRLFKRNKRERLIENGIAGSIVFDLLWCTSHLLLSSMIPL